MPRSSWRRHGSDEGGRSEDSRSEDSKRQSPQRHDRHERRYSDRPPDRAGVKKAKVDKRQECINLEATGVLAEEANLRHGVVAKLVLPPNSRAPTKGEPDWRLFIFKAGVEDFDKKPLRLRGQVSYLMGKDLRIVDIPALHESVSKQHAAIVFRAKPLDRHSSRQPSTPKKDESVPYLIDLESTNGTYLNGEKIEASRFYELKNKDGFVLGKSTREYVVMRDDTVDVDEVRFEDLLDKRIEEEKAAKEVQMAKVKYWRRK